MKRSFLTKALSSAVLIFVASFCVSAQTRTIEHDYSEFDSIVASNGFKVVMVESDAYSTKLTVDDALESYVQCYVKAKTLYLSVDEKNIPKDLKKSYKSKNASDPIIKAIVYVPRINSLKLSSNAEFSSDVTMDVENFDLNVSDNSKANNLKLNVSNTATITVGKKSQVGSLKVQTKDLQVNSDSNGILTGDFAATKVTVNNAGSAEVTLNGNCEDFFVSAAGNAKLLVAGNAKTLSVGGKGNQAKVDANGLKVESAILTISGVSVIVDADDTLTLDIEKSSDVVFSGDPDIKIVKISSSSVNRK